MRTKEVLEGKCGDVLNFTGERKRKKSEEKKGVCVCVCVCVGRGREFYNIIWLEKIW